ncbi:MAG: hypothetical protein JO131_03215 [Gammaproteobacteria bacterium]|nr:hypothetical protein [Gammaproteobacteria bacterium]
MFTQLDENHFFYRVYNIAIDEKEWKKSEYLTINFDLQVDCRKIDSSFIDKAAIELFIKNPITKGQVTPISLLAYQGNHKAVSFLLKAGSSTELAIQGYQIGGYLSNEEQRQKLLASISDTFARERIDEASSNFFLTKFNCKIL